MTNATSASTSSPPTNGRRALISLDTIGKFIIWLLPIIFVAGGLYKMIESSAEAATLAIDKVQEADIASAREHSRIDQNDAAMTRRIELVEKTQSDILTEQRRQGENISAICQATNARCR